MRFSVCARACSAGAIPVSCFVLVIMGILSVWKGGIPFSCYMRYMGVPLVFLLLSSLAIIINFSGEPP